jgi:hypothetical protein
MTTPQRQSFLEAYAVGPTDSVTIQAKRLEDAKASAALSGAERDRAVQRDISANNLTASREIAKQNHDQAEADKAQARTIAIAERYRAPYVATLGKLQSKLDDAVAAGTDLHEGTPVGQAVGVIKTLSAMASGQGSGVRITQAELNSLAGARFGSTYAAYAEKLATGKSLTDTQVRDIQGLLADVQARVAMKEHTLNHGLDAMNDANSPEDVKKADTMIRRNLANIEKVPAGAGLLADPSTGEPVGYIQNGKRKAF